MCQVHHDLLAQAPLSPAYPSEEANWPSLCLSQDFARVGQAPGLSKKSEGTGQTHTMGLRPVLKTSWHSSAQPTKPLGTVVEGWCPPWRVLISKASPSSRCNCQSVSPAPGCFSGCTWWKGISPHKGTFPKYYAGSSLQLPAVTVRFCSL